MELVTGFSILLIFGGLVVVGWTIAGKLYRKYYWWDRKKRIETALRLQVKDDEILQEAANKILRERGYRP